MRRFPCTLNAGACGLLLAGCIGRGEGVRPGPLDEDPDAGVPFVGFAPDAAPGSAAPKPPPSDPHAVRAVTPSHGPFTGGQTALVRGTGFESNVRVWFGDAEVPSSEILPVDASRVQVSVPAGSAGVVDISVQNGDDASTRRALVAGYVYDAFYVEPSQGPTAGGTVITLHGNGTEWDDSTEVLVDLEPCEVLRLRGSPGELQELECRTPPGTPGTKVVRTVTAERSHDVLDAFVYGDSDNGFRGGLSGGPLGERLSVLVLGNDDGRPVADATVVVNTQGDEHRRTTGETGGAIVESDELGPRATVTVTARCRMPITLVDVSVDTLTLYVNRVLTPECRPEGDPPAVGGSPRASARIQGEVVFPGSIEFRRPGWTAVPEPRGPNSRRAAYVLELENDPRRAFRLPSETTAVTTDADGTVGYDFDYRSGLGNLTLYALAGIEDRSVNPPVFTAYAMGLVRGILAEPGETTENVFIRIDNTLDHALSLAIEGPTPTGRGPDRLRTHIAVRVGTLGYALLPLIAQDRLLPITGPSTVVGLPALVGSLAGSDFALSAVASTGQSGTVPRSVLNLLVQGGSEAVSVDGFVQIPRLVNPSTNGPWDGRHLILDAAAGGGHADLSLVEVHAGNGLWRWTIAAPATTSTIELPDPRTLPDLGLRPGPLTFELARAKIRDDFDYGSLRTTELRAQAWQAYAVDTVQAHYE